MYFGSASGQWAVRSSGSAPCECAAGPGSIRLRHSISVARMSQDHVLCAPRYHMPPIGQPNDEPTRDARPRPTRLCL
eukprot:882516-Prymnesium_polylepis.1